MSWQLWRRSDMLQYLPNGRRGGSRLFPPTTLQCIYRNEILSTDVLSITNNKNRIFFHPRHHPPPLMYICRNLYGKNTIDMLGWWGMRDLVSCCGQTSAVILILLGLLNRYPVPVTSSQRFATENAAGLNISPRGKTVAPLSLSHRKTELTDFCLAPHMFDKISKMFFWCREFWNFKY